ncbi:hypothetical protein N8D74_17760 (plasmid) [Curtobacterium flaccumfaciens]|uniref:Uncharacterized protein n=1 Tax=Curtobacterium poinsettiae TaxID=159612 RepID=A0A9Q9PAE0_9MICO|nr:hypothetical protein [Curtobacterium flaccumfaciens]MBT1620572.1 hypothetical protein [Curtobacterium flaccumfaciens pv. poinsettiae]MCS6563602.1 hypothetical protein [Curtobacterium flaccumfaciens pv. poinsettiae]MCU0154540.1 hypothetical protein [Curtobacterium flaccumfaciens pv. poinsettiae]UXN16923.1 hypothetical protein N8D76_17210 [Curtobacterium flaccumfaciens pv. poinsettiae]UXN27128.1 hypothetical protein N8D74_17760 [Curtobacterium flaccumfaciens]
MLELHQVFQTHDYRSPFDLTLDGYTDRWWNMHRSPVGESRYDTFTFIADGVEVARAEVDPDDAVLGEYVDLDTPVDVARLTFFEVRAPRRREGLGRAAVELLAEHYPRTVLAAFSEQADQFWTACGWRLHRRSDGDPRFQPLFVHRSG